MNQTMVERYVRMRHAELMEEARWARVVREVRSSRRSVDGNDAPAGSWLRGVQRALAEVRS